MLRKMRKVGILSTILLAVVAAKCSATTSQEALDAIVSAGAASDLAIDWRDDADTLLTLWYGLLDPCEAALETVDAYYDDAEAEMDDGDDDHTAGVTDLTDANSKFQSGDYTGAKAAAEAAEAHFEDAQDHYYNVEQQHYLDAEAEVAAICEEEECCCGS